MQKVEDVTYLTAEYAVMVSECKSLDNDVLEDALITDADWTTGGAEELVRIAKHYGSFMLRNALALSIALGIEDGEAGF